MVGVGFGRPPNRAPTRHICRSALLPLHIGAGFVMLANEAQVVHVCTAADALDHRIVVGLDLE